MTITDLTEAAAQTKLAEENLLRSVLAGARTDEVTPNIRGQDFYLPIHEEIWNTIAALEADGIRPDVLTIITTLAGRPGFDQSLLLDLMDGIPSNADYYAALVKRSADLRRLGQEITRADDARRRPEADPDTIRDTLRQRLDDLADTTGSGMGIAIGDAFKDLLDDLDNGQEPGHSLPWTSLSNTLNGLQGGRFYVVAARPGGGKSVFLLDAALHFAIKHEIPVLYASLEMGAPEITRRALSNLARIDSQELERKKNLTEEQWAKIAKASPQFMAAPIRLYDAQTPTVADIRRLARSMRRDGLGLIVIDYLQLMQSTGPANQSEVDRLSDITRALKRLSLELDVPVLVATQLNRVEGQGDQREPQLHHLRGSGTIEQDADVVMLMHPDRSAPDANIVKVRVAKQRSGPNRTHHLELLGHFSILQQPRHLDDATGWAPTACIADTDHDNVRPLWTD